MAQPFPNELKHLYDNAEFIGSGGFARVFKARRKDGRVVAVKIPLSLDEATGKSFLREITSWQRLSHKNIVSLFDANILPIPYLEQEYCDGGSLESLKKPLEISKACEIVFDIAEGLKYAHKQGIVHRDLKPQNILLTKDEVPKITDWGMSRVIAESRSSTEDGYTPAYASPEQVSPKKFGKTDERTDIYQLGVIFYNLLTNELPFKGDNLAAIALAIAMEKPVAPSELNPESREVEHVVLRCLSKNKEERYQSVEKLQKELSKFIKKPKEKQEEVQKKLQQKTARREKPKEKPYSYKRRIEEAEEAQEGEKRREEKLRKDGEQRILRIFLCHSSGDKPKVRDLYERLLAEGFDPWLDEEKLLPGQKWKTEIPKAVRASDVVIVCLSRSAVNKAGYIQKEIKFALDVADEQPEGTIFLIPLKLEECEVPERLSEWQWVNLFEERGFERLMRALRTRQSGEVQKDLEVRERIRPQVKQELESPRTDEISKTYTSAIGMKFVLIHAGEFMMGSEEEFNWEKPVHKVTISSPFFLGIYPVTQREWEKDMGNSPSYFKGDDLPVENVSWNDVQEFIKKLNKKEGMDKYRLPSEAEWEYAARAGTITRYSFGDDESKLSDYAWYDANSERKTHEVGQKKPNPWGLYDVHGNVWEWVQDKWNSNYKGAPTDGSAWEGSVSGSVDRGGDWFDSARDLRSANRGSIHDPGSRVLGFRLLRVP